MQIVLFCTIAAIAFSVPRTSAAMPPQEPASKPDWRLLYFSWFDDSRVVTKVTFRLQDFKNFEPTTVLEVESVDPVVLKRVQRGLMLAFRFATPRTGGGANVNLGEMEITTNQETFKVGVGRVFSLQSETPDSASSFFSWTLATVVDDLLVSRTGKGLTDERVKSLSGELTIANQRAEYERENASRSKPQEK